MCASRTAAALVGAFIMLAGGTASAAGMQQTEPTDPVTVVENFLLARDIRDSGGAAFWCAALLDCKTSTTKGLWTRRLPASGYAS